MVTAEEALALKYTIYDVVLPLPGNAYAEGGKGSMAFTLGKPGGCVNVYIHIIYPVKVDIGTRIQS